MLVIAAMIDDSQAFTCARMAHEILEAAAVDTQLQQSSVS
jgi:hypothetical protein